MNTNWKSRIYILLVLMLILTISVQGVASTEVSTPKATTPEITTPEVSTPEVSASEPAQKPVQKPAKKPAQIKGVTLKIHGDNNARVNVKFAVDENATKYEIYRKTVSVAGKKVKTGYTLKKTTTSTGWTDKNVRCGNRYSYKVRGVNSAGQAGKFSSEKDIFLILGYSQKQLKLIKRLVASGGTKAGKYTYKNGEFKLLGEEILVNKHNYLNNKFNGMNIVTASGLKHAPGRPQQRISKTAHKPMKQMFKAAKQDGIVLLVFDIYRTRTQQTTYYNNKVNYFKGYGYSTENARVKASTITAIPNTSEHQSGLAIDILSPGAMIRNSTFANSKAGKWLEKNSWKYGFILRYMKNKTKQTEIIFEPWHYRYVGRPLARLLKEEKICLEEYYRNIEKYNAKYVKYKANSKK